MKCKRVLENNLITYQLIKKHLDKYKLYNHIEDETKSFTDFVNKYAWIIREVYCLSICPDKNICRKLSKIKLNTNLLNIIKNYKYARVLSPIIQKYLDKHKIDNYEDAVENFLKEYGWIAKELLDQKYAKGGDI